MIVTGPARNAHRCNSDINVTGVTKHFIVGFKDYSIRYNLYMPLLLKQEPMSRQVIGPRGESSTIWLFSIDTVLDILLMTYHYTH